jgi:hypothetical protein
MSGTTLGAETHLSRARQHETVADALGENEWAAVPYFYAAYHIVKCALIEDPIFDDVTRLHGKHYDLVPDDRYTDRHKGRKVSSSGREWGINELVYLMYPSVVGAYERLHQASIDVRYRAGLRGATSDLRDCLTKIRDAYEQGQMRASLSTS